MAAEFVLGFKDFAEQNPGVGEPLEDEFDLVPGRIRVQPTSAGALLYYVESNTVHFFAAASHS